MMMTRLVPMHVAASDAWLQRRLASVFQGIAESPSAAAFSPAIDVYEDDTKLVVTLEVAGVKQDDLKVEVDGRRLTVSGERKFASDEQHEKFTRIERRYGTFTRSFTLPAAVETGSIQAKYQDGVLAIELAKREQAKPVQVKIEVPAVNQPQAVEAPAAQ